jgi:small subunit ribosomal protein S7
MSRRHRADKRHINPDPKFGDLVISKFMNSVMIHGKKSIAESIVYGAIDMAQIQKSNQDGVEIFHQALGNVAPNIEVRSRRVGGCDLSGAC